MGSQHPHVRKRKPLRWRARVCNYCLYKNGHWIRSRKAWQKHQLDLGKLLAGAWDAQPLDKQTTWACEGQQLTDSDLDINSSIASDPYAGSEYQSLREDDISHAAEYLSGDPGTASSAMRASPITADAVTTFGLCPPSNASAISHLSQAADAGIGNRFSDSQADTGSSMISTLRTTTGSRISEQSSTTCDQNHDLAETTFLDEVELLIGDPDDWTSSDDSVAGDPFEVGLMKTGVIDEDVLEDYGNPDILELGDVSVVDFQGGLIGAGPGGGDTMVGDGHESGFLYDNETDPWTEEELISFLLYDIKRRHTVTRGAQERYTNLIRHFSPLTPFCFPTTLDRLENLTGICHERYDCCINSCMAFTESESNHYLICLSPRYDKSGKAVKTMDYIPLIHQLRLQYSCASRAKTFMSYLVRCMDEHSRSGIITDIWNGKLLRNLKGKRLFNYETDIALSFHTDGVKLFKTRSAFHIWPLTIIINNIPPEERFKCENIILLGLIPGPQQPKDIDSFLRPLVNELKLLQEGIPGVYNGATKDYFILRAHVCLIGADTKGREQLMGISTNSYSYCFYCKARGLHSGGSHGHIYCPLTRPITNPPPPQSQGPGGARSRNNDLFHNLDPARLDLRTDEGFRNNAWTAFTSDPPQAANGISRLPIWCELKSIIFPWCFVLDEMHLFWENVIILLFNHWRGRFFNRRDLRARKFEKTADIYNIDPGLWGRIGEGMESSKGDFPTAWGDAFRNLVKHCHEFKAAEWRNFSLLIVPIVLAGNVLPNDCYEAFCDLIEAIESATSDIPFSDIDTTIGLPLINFLKHYEAVYYQHKWDRLETCRSQIHLLAHVADFVEWCGPMNLYSQWSCERLCGSIAQGIRNHVQANRATSLNIIRQQQIFHIPFLARQTTGSVAEQMPANGEPDPFLDVAGYDEQDLDIQCPGTYLETLIEISITDIRSFQNFRPRGPKPAVGLRDGPKAGEPDNLYLPPIALYGPVKRKIKTYIRGLVFQFLQESGIRIPRQSIPKVITAYRTAEAHDGSFVSSDDLRPGNATRSRSYAQYLWGNNRATRKHTYYGRVLFFSFKLTGSALQYPEIYLALVQDFRCQEEGRLQRIVKVERQEIISARDVVGLVGVVKNGINNSSYIVKQRTALIG